MGPNGSGKSTLTHTVIGREDYKQTEGQILVDGKDISNEETYLRARAGVFASMQYPVEVPGVPVASIFPDSLEDIESEAKNLAIEESFLLRGVNDEFSGGERKRMEVLQLAVSDAKYVILDEIDSGLDVDALRIIAERIMKLVKERNLGIIVITHYERLLEYLVPTHVHVFSDGKIIKSGGRELVDTLEEQGYEKIVAEA
jgi:Fe-S cluster assembly ATP-binding protein